MMKKYIQWLGTTIRPHFRSLAAMMSCHVMLAVCSVSFVYISKSLVDAAVTIFSGGHLENEIWQLMLAMIAVIILRISLNACRTYLQTKTEIRIKNSLRRRIYDILLHVTTDGSRRHHSGDILNRIQEDVRVIASTLAGSIPNLLGTLLQFIAALCFMLYLDVRLAAIILIVLPVGMFVGKFITTRIRSLTHEIRKKDSKVQSHLQESIQHLTLLQTLEYEDTSSDTLNDLQSDLYGSEIRRTKFNVVSRIFVSLAFQTGHLIAFMWGVIGISQGTVTYGMMTAFLQLVGQIQRPLLDMSGQIPSIIHSTTSIDRIIEIESLPQEKYGEPILLQAPAGIRLENVTFSYPDSTRQILDNFSYDFTPGSRTAIVGQTGIGKSTMIRLLLSLLKPLKGDIIIYSRKDGLKTEGTDTSSYSHQESLAASPDARCNLVYVPQGNTLFSGTIRDNLLMGNPDATDEQLQAVLYTAAADFVTTLPDGLDSQCFESGGGLSEGQAQRIAIARALLRPGSILLLDEFSSALDAETETTLMERLTSNLPKHTMIFITHREKIIDYCENTLRLG